MVGIFIPAHNLLVFNAGIFYPFLLYLPYKVTILFSKKLIFVVNNTILDYFFMYHFNKFLFRKLPMLFGMTQIKFSEMAFGAGHKFARKLANQDTLQFSELVDLCNRTHISMADFISLESEMQIHSNKYKYVIPEDRFQPIIFQPENIRHVYGLNGLAGGISREEFAERMGISSNTATRWINPATCTISVPEMLSLCNTFRINLSMFVEDKNRQIDQIEEQEPINPVNERVWRELSDLRKITSVQSRELENLKAENLRLQLETNPDHVCENTAKPSQVRKWEANWPLLENLHTVAGVQKRDIIRAAGMQNYNTSFNNGDLPVQSLVSLCNTYHISTRHFLHRGIIPSEPLHELQYYQSEDWDEIEFHPENLNDLFGKNSITGMTREELSQTSCLSEMKIRWWRKPSSSMRISELLNICNELDVTPSCFLTDRNRTDLGWNVTYTEFLLEENRLLKQQILRLQEKIKKLKNLRKSSDKNG